jgi:hypothetical protein
LFDFALHTFTTCGQTGRVGPSSQQCRGEYATAWADDVDLYSVANGVQFFTVPGTGSYRIEVWGGQGGINHGGDQGGRGARMRGAFDLEAGQTLGILVGHEGVISPNGNTANGGSGGGGGTFVWIAGADLPLIAAGGGGGSGLRNPGDPDYRGRDATTAEDGTFARDDRGPGGVDGGDAPHDGGQGWASVRGAPEGRAGRNTYGGDGGFGGGGGGGYGPSGNNQHAAGGGGGYSGGGNCEESYHAGGGGGSYNGGTDQSNESGANGGHGQVSIERL